MLGQLFTRLPGTGYFPRIRLQITNLTGQPTISITGSATAPPSAAALPTTSHFLPPSLATSCA